MKSTMTTYHVNPKTGDPNACRANDPASCPFKGHNADPEACRKVYESAMSAYTIVSVSKSRGLLYNGRKIKGRL